MEGDFIYTCTDFLFSKENWKKDQNTKKKHFHLNVENNRLYSINVR